jgi:NAD(P)-dependent dehydrogenase (short-subunit alcohol dehydrogenase family)
MRYNKTKSGTVISPHGFRWAEPEDLAGTAVCLASFASDYINGQVIFVDGGYLAM